MHRSARLLFASAFLCAIFTPSAARALSVIVAYDLADSRSSGAFSAQEQAVFAEAAVRWSQSIAGTHSVTVTFIRSNPGLAGSLSGNLGFATDFVSDGGSSGGRELGNPTSGTALINDTATFFVDTSPSDSIEFSASGQSGAPSTYLESGPAGHDLLSVALHEIGHALGFDSDFQDFWTNVGTSPHPSSFGRSVYAFASPSASGDFAYDPGNPMGLANGGVFLTAPVLEADDFKNAGKPTHADDVGGAAPGAGYFPFDLMNPGLNTTERRLISAMDVDILCDAYSAYSCTVVPEPSRAALVSLALLVCIGRVVTRSSALGA